MIKNILKLLMLIGCVLGGVSCADLDVRSDGRVTYEDIFRHYGRTKNYFTGCINKIPNISLTSYGGTALASFCDEAHDASDCADGAVSDWYKGYATASYFPITSPWGAL